MLWFIAILAAIVSGIFSTFVLWCGWGWFITPVFHIAVPTWGVIFGLDCLASLIRYSGTSLSDQKAQQNMDSDEKATYHLQRIVDSFIFYGVSLLFMWVAHTCQ